MDFTIALWPILFSTPKTPHTTAMTEELITIPLSPLYLTMPTPTISHPPAAAPSPNSSPCPLSPPCPSSPSCPLSPPCPLSPLHPPFSETLDDTSPLPYSFPPLDNSTLPTTHAARNPHLSIQQSQTNQKLSMAQKATKALQAQATKDKQLLLLNVIQEFQEKHKKEFEALAHTHLVAVEYV
jgi:hypothetical protein